MSAPLSPTVSACSSNSPTARRVRNVGAPPPMRRRLAPSQTSTLVSVFEVKTHPSREERALLAAELGMEMKAVNSWFQNKRRSLKKTWQGIGGWSKGSLPENKHVRPQGGPRTLAPNESALSLDHVASLRELPYKQKATVSSRCPPLRVPATPKRRACAFETSREIWELLPSSPPTRPSSPSYGEPLLALDPCARRRRSLEWACAKARAGRRISVRAKSLRAAAEEDNDVPMLVLDSTPARRCSSSDDDTETEESEEDEAITPNVSTELLPPVIISGNGDSDGGEVMKLGPGKHTDMEAAIALLGFKAPEPAP
ncbi:hypothetical protein K466DRAFT_516547 [Polyporus arcularius HHB13444]|uniref:Homeobox domain-containing protein n=1 Tax=Polyporus arcularius HHB13444 TaxID=1314778 RepID=A0A5C3PR18_9APHY|nr:hypothetical protein K466DRAFT_516547 [Polyporus arcularius HHB13444]